MSAGSGLTMPLETRLVLLGGSAHPDLAEAVADELSVSMPEVELGSFANGERRVRIHDAPKEVGGADVFVLQSHGGHLGVDQAIAEQVMLINAAKLAGAKRVTAVCPSFGYTRQDKYTPGEPKGAYLVANQLALAGAKRLLTIDLHADQIQGLFPGPVDHLEAWPVFVPYLRQRFDTSAMVMVSPDAGRVDTADKYAADLGTNVAVIHKHRQEDVANSSQSLAVIGDVAGKGCIMIDDLIDTGGSVVHGARLLKEHDAGDIWVVATHPVLSRNALCTLGDEAIKGVIVADTLPLADAQECTGNHPHAAIERVSIAPLLARAIFEIFSNGSVSTLLQKPDFVPVAQA